MKRIFFIVTAVTLLLTACNNSTTDLVATDVVPQAATEVIPAAAPGPDSGGKVATEVVPAE